VAGIVGIIPAAGRTVKMMGLPKFLLPIRGGYLLDSLCKRMTNAGTDMLVIVANPAYHDLAFRFSPAGTIVYSMNSLTISAAVMAARNVAGNSRVLFGFPDCYWEGDFIYRNLLWGLEDDDVIACVGVWKARDGQHPQLGMCEVTTTFDRAFQSQYLKVTKIVQKPTQTSLEWGWGAIAWKPEFWGQISPNDESLSESLQRAIANEKVIRAVKCDGDYWNCNDTDEYFELVRTL
jgi:molybdopterin-guanine dinucleotide biosynthesis protein A